MPATIQFVCGVEAIRKVIVHKPSLSSGGIVVIVTPEVSRIIHVICDAIKYGEDGFWLSRKMYVWPKMHYNASGSGEPHGCTIGTATRVGPFVEIQRNAVIGSNAIQSHTFICEVSIGNAVFVGHGVMFTNDLMPRRPQARAIWPVTRTGTSRRP